MPTNRNINGFRTGFHGVRPNRFKVTGAFPEGAGASDTLFDIYIKAADLPASTVGVIQVAWQGRIVKFSGERVYTEWVISVYDSNKEAESLRSGFEKWIEKMDQRIGHNIDYNLVENWTLYYNDLNGTSTNDSEYRNSITLVNCFPLELGPVQMNYDLSDTFSEFTVILAYDYWTPNAPGSGITNG